MRFKLYVSFVLCILLHLRAFAQNDTYEFSRLDITNGLSDNQVNCIYKDEKGFMWFGTTSGLNRYDGSKFKVFKRDNKNPNSLAENHVMRIDGGPGHKMWVFTHNSISIYDPETEQISNNIAAEAKRYNIPNAQITQVKKDILGNFWFVTNRAGLYCYNPSTKATVFYSTLNNSPVALHSDRISIIVPSPQKTVWIMYDDGVIEELNTGQQKIARTFTAFAEAIGLVQRTYNMQIDHMGNLWICCYAAPIGVYSYNTRTNELLHYSKDTPGRRLNANLMTSMIQADNNKIWIGSDHGGINVIDPVTHEVSFIMSKPDDAKSLSGNSVYLYKDNTGIVWVGTFKQGINYYHSGMMQFPLYKHYANDINSLPFGDINSFEEDEKHNLWIGTNGNGLLYFNRAANTYTRFKHNPADPNSIANDIIVRLHIDKNKKLWIGTYFGGLDSYDGTKFTHYRHNEKDASSITDDRVYAITEDAAGEMWVGTFAGGFNVFDAKTNSFKHPKYPMASEYTAIIYEDKNRNKWIGMDKGVDVIDYRTNKVRHYLSQPSNRNSLVGNDVNAITQDRRGLIWIGTKDGLSILDTKTNNFLNIEEGVNLPANNVSNIIEDKQGIMWVSTTNGLARIRLNQVGGKYKFLINNYNELDGLQGRAFNLYSALRLQNGELVFGGINGFNLFDPNIVNTFKPKPNLVFTDLHLFNKSVTPGDTINGDVILTRALSEIKQLTLEHDQNVFDIEFAACDYFNPDKAKFEYKLEGFDKNWITVAGDNRKATYTNLDGGDYVFKVRTQNANVDDTISLNITVKPPFLKSPLAYFSYFILLMGALLYIRHRGILKLKREFDARQAKTEGERKIAREREEARRMHQLDLMKIKFFTNISHEFRTPLSLILSPIDNLIKTSDKPEQHNQLLTIKRNGKRLLNLVNQLLDFRKMEYNELKLILKKGDIIQFIKEVSASFKDVAQQKQIQFLIESDVASYVTDFDHDKIERILFNLLSNAFKFTPSGGHISVMLGMAAVNGHKGEQNRLEIKVIDTGIGIPKENQEKIFERFFQDDMPENLLNQGSGIGLSITKEFVKMQGGTIEIESEPDYGSCFSISLPVGKQLEASELPAVVESAEPEMAPAMLKNPENMPGSSKKPTILLVEDNDDLRFYLKDNLKHSFHIVEAVNGKDGWQKALAMHPKLIVSDISMPVMTGTELCKKIKADSRTAEIPVILLTALGTEEDQLAGLDSGANDYIVKPFNFEILLSKIHNSLRMQSTFKKTYQKQLDVQAKDIVVVSEDEKFLKNAFDHIEKNITNLNFSVEELARQLNLSRVSLYKKLLTLTGKTPVDCIRTIRLKRAVQLLEKSKLSIANVAYEVGFNNAAYFAKVFKEEYGILPSEYINELKKNEKEAELV